MSYAKNKIVARTVTVEPVRWYEISSKRDTVLVLNGEFTFDFYQNIDRNLWLGYVEKHKQKMNSPESNREYLTRQLLVKDYIEKQSGLPQTFRDIVPYGLQEGPQAFLYNELISDARLVENHLIPFLRKAGYFDPITPGMEKLFFRFDISSFSLETTEIPDNFTTKRIFVVKFKLLFDVKKYFNYLVINKGASFSLSLFPVFEFKMRFNAQFPYKIFIDRVNFFNWLQNHMVMFMHDDAIIKYVYSKTKIRLDKLSRISYRMPFKELTVIIDVPDIVNFVQQLIYGKINFGGRYSHDFAVQKIDRDIGNKYIATGRSSLIGNIIFFLVFYKTYSNAFKTKLNVASSASISNFIKEVAMLHNMKRLSILIK